MPSRNAVCRVPRLTHVTGKHSAGFGFYPVTPLPLGQITGRCGRFRGQQWRLPVAVGFAKFRLHRSNARSPAHGSRWGRRGPPAPRARAIKLPGWSGSSKTQVCMSLPDFQLPLRANVCLTVLKSCTAQVFLHATVGFDRSIHAVLASFCQSASRKRSSNHAVFWVPSRISKRPVPMASLAGNAGAAGGAGGNSDGTDAAGPASVDRKTASTIALMIVLPRLVYSIPQMQTGKCPASQTPTRL